MRFDAFAFEVLFVTLDFHLRFHAVFNRLLVSVGEINVFYLHTGDAQVGVFGERIHDGILAAVVQLFAVLHGADGGELTEDGF